MTQPALDRLANTMAGDGWSLRPGERVGAYTVRELVGAGGAGEVWRATDERLGRDVAIKALLPHLSGDPDRIRRFTEEARTAGALNHSNILSVYDVGEHGGAPFIVSEYVEGESLRARLKGGHFQLIRLSTSRCRSRAVSRPPMLAASSIATSSRRTSSCGPTAV